MATSRKPSGQAAGATPSKPTTQGTSRPAPVVIDFDDCAREVATALRKNQQ